MRWDGMVDHSGEGRGKVVRGDVGCWEVLWVVRGTCVVCRVVGTL